MLERMRHAIAEHRMLTAGDMVIVAVSGGPDSVALLHALHRLAPEFAVTLHVFHMDHGLRGERSTGDAEYVRALARQLNLPCTVARLPAGSLQAQTGSLEANARSLRYAELEALSASIGANRAATGHNRNDQAETVLMRFLRGAGARGLSGIPPVRQAGDLTYIRPLLRVSRPLIEEYCHAAELFPRQDESNVKPDYLRNKIRLELLPHLTRTYNPALAENLAQTAELMREEDQFLDTLALEALGRCRAPDNAMAFPGAAPTVIEGGIALVGAALLAEPPVIARRVVRLAARAVAGPTLDLGLDPVNRVLEAAAKSDGSHRLDLPGGLTLTIEYGICRFTPPAESVPPTEGWPVALSGTTDIPELGISLEAGHSGQPEGPLTATFDADLLPGPLSVRLRRPGDRIWPAGMEGSKKLQDLLSDAKIPRSLRDRIPLLLSGDEILWVIGHRLDRRFLASSSTVNVQFVHVNHLS